VTSGARAYLCVGGGIATEPVLGSRATHIASGVGGRPLRAGESLPIGNASGPARSVSPDGRGWLVGILARRTLRIAAGAHWWALPAEATATLCTSPFVVTEQSDRMGLRFDGSRLVPDIAGRMVTEGVPPGSIQIPESGQPILLMADRPTTGGYPVVACVCAVDLHACGQLRPRDTVRFTLVEIREARRLFQEFQSRLDRMLPAHE
jgi:antagonist of KipI